MTNYTYEQRKMIADYLENEVLTKQHQIKDHPDDNFNTGYYMAVDSSIIENLIDELTNLTFGEIKHQAGVKFKYDGFEYAIGYDVEYDCFQVIDLETFKISDLNLINDYEKVEVINET